MVVYAKAIDVAINIHIRYIGESRAKGAGGQSGPSTIF